MKYKALISDLDGTMIPNGPLGMPSHKVLEAISKAREKIHISVATGRELRLATPILDALNLTGPVILLNGALIIDGATREPLYEQPMIMDDYTSVMDIIRKTSFRYLIETKDTVHERYDEEPQNPLVVFVWDITDEQANILIRKFSNIPTLSLYKVSGWKEGTVGLNIAHKLATKQHAIYELGKILNIRTHEIIGIGDGPNDFPLLMASGLKVAMGNAIPDLKAIADYVTATVEEDGVAQVIEKFVLSTNSRNGK